jgi:hypothetical protein
MYVKSVALIAGTLLNNIFVHVYLGCSSTSILFSLVCD